LSFYNTAYQLAAYFQLPPLQIIAVFSVYFGQAALTGFAGCQHGQQKQAEGQYAPQ
jgi:hypothetical protein